MFHRLLNAMTTYEKIATNIALLALLQPWIIKIWSHFFRKIHVDFIPSSKINLYYNRSGAYIYLGGVIESKNKNAVIRDIAVRIVRKKDKAELLLDWSSFRVPVFQSVGGNPIITSEIARPFKVESDSLYPVFVEFASTNTQETNHLIEIYDKIAAEVQHIIQPNLTRDEAKSQLTRTDVYKNYRDELLQNFYWKADDYTIELTIEYNETKILKYHFRFNISTEEASEFKNNIEKSLQCGIDEIYRIPTNLLCPQKDFIVDNI